MAETADASGDAGRGLLSSDWWWRAAIGLVFLVTIAKSATAAPAAQVGPLQRAVDESDRVVLTGNVHPLARPEFDAGRTDGSLPEERMILALAMRPEKKAALERLLVEQQDPGSPNFHHWLTPEEFGARFGATSDEIGLVTGWLQSHGFVIDEVGKGGTWINFTGTVADVEIAFRTEIHDYAVDGEMHHANASDPSIPRALSDLVAGVVSLHDFRTRIASHQVQPSYTLGNGVHWLVPGDFATIYNVKPLYNAGINGSGQSIAVVGRTNMNVSDVQTFRNTVGLPAKDPKFIFNGSDPGIVSTGEESEAVLDVEWSGAAAPNATILMVISKSTNTSGGDMLSAQYIVNNNLAPVLTMSFSLCEASLGTSWNQFYSNMWSQAMAEGISVFVSAGDSGAAGCDTDSPTTATHGLAVSGLCSTPYDVCVGGTEFMDSPTSSYWSPNNDPTTKASAVSYIPEEAWNESGAAPTCPTDVTCRQLWATGGGASTVYPKPAWQVAPGVPNDGARDVPDVALAAAGHNFYFIVQQDIQQPGYINGADGTSAATPSLAGLMALVVQKTRERQGNPNPRLYQLGSAQYNGSGPPVFHDVTVGNNSVPGQPGFWCGTGYDLATGLGSVDATVLVNNWTCTSPSIISQPQSRTIQSGQSVTLSVAASGTGPFTYQWYQWMPIGGTWSRVGTNSATYTTPTLTSTTNYLVRVSNACGTAYSTMATITISGGCASPSITAQPQSRTIQSGQSVTLSVTASGTGPFSYQWYQWEPFASRWSRVGTNWATYTTPALTSTTNYWVWVSNACGTAYSTMATITIKGGCIAPSITAQPQSQTIQGGQSVTLSVTGGGTAPLSYQWYQWEPIGGTWTWSPVGTNSATYTTPALTSTTNYWVWVSNACGTAYGTMATITISGVCTAPSITVQPQSQTIQSGQSATLSVTAGGTAPLSYQWYQWEPFGSTWARVGTNSATYTTPALTSTTNYWVWVSNACGTAYGTMATVTVS